MVLEATGNTIAIVRLLKPHAGRVVIANTLQVRVIADAKVKTDRIDAAVLRKRLHAAGYLPEVWQPRRGDGVPAPAGRAPRWHRQGHDADEGTVSMQCCTRQSDPAVSGQAVHGAGTEVAGQEQPWRKMRRAAVDRWLAASSTAWSRSWLTPNGHSPRLVPRR